MSSNDDFITFSSYSNLYELNEELLHQNMSKLDVSFNRIRKIDIINNYYLLEECDARNNSIEDFELNLLKLRRLHYLNLSLNRLHTLKILNKSKNLIKLVLNNNNLKNISCLRNLSLEYLDLSNNLIESIDDITTIRIGGQ